MAKRMRKPDIRIEFPMRGQTYCRQQYGVYEYGVYPRTSVLAGQQSRKFLDSFKTLEEAKAKYPEAKESGCGHIDVDVLTRHLPDDGDY